MIEPIATDAFRRKVTDYAREASDTNESIAVGTTGGRPTYLLSPVPEDQRDQIRCVRLGPDELRRNFSEIRSLIRLEDIPFGVMVGDQLIAILRRHPDYRPAAADNYRAMYRHEPDKTKGRIVESRIDATETRLSALEATLAGLSARLTAVEKRGSPGERPSSPTAVKKSTKRHPNPNAL
jgi:hypothetical protein